MIHIFTDSRLVIFFRGIVRLDSLDIKQKHLVLFLSMSRYKSRYKIKYFWANNKRYFFLKRLRYFLLRQNLTRLWWKFVLEQNSFPILSNFKSRAAVQLQWLFLVRRLYWALRLSIDSYTAVMCTLTILSSTVFVSFVSGLILEQLQWRQSVSYLNARKQSILRILEQKVPS